MTQNFITCLNGQFTRDDQAMIALADRGFRFGDGAFETIRLHRGVPYQWALHIARLRAGLAALQIPIREIEWGTFARQVIQRNRAGDGFLRISVSRGVGSRGYLPLPNIAPTWAVEYLPPSATATQPYRLWLSDIAKIPPQCLPANHKLAQGINSTLAALDAQTHICDDALQLTLDGCISETSAANIFWVKNDELFTPSLATNCLRGTTRDAMLRLSPAPVHGVQATLPALEMAESVFITNARLGVHAVASLAPMGWNFATNHPLIINLQQRLLDDYDADCAAFLAQFPKWSA